jgi:ComF family protein
MVPGLIAELRSVGPYDGWLRASVQLIKYQSEFSRVEHLAPFAVSAMRTLGSPGALVPVPLHSQRIRERGFNQSALLAEAMADLSGIEIRDCLIRVRDTPHQVGLTAFERASNVEGAFSIREMPSGMPRSVVLIDDVFTTGATVAACAEVLRQHGAHTISALTIC